MKRSEIRVIRSQTIPDSVKLHLGYFLKIKFTINLKTMLITSIDTIGINTTFFVLKRLSPDKLPNQHLSIDSRQRNRGMYYPLRA